MAEYNSTSFNASDYDSSRLTDVNFSSNFDSYGESYGDSYGGFGSREFVNMTYGQDSVFLPEGVNISHDSTFEGCPVLRGPFETKNKILDTTYDCLPSNPLNTTYNKNARGGTFTMGSPPRALNTTFNRSPPRGPGPALNTTFDLSPPRGPGPALNTTFDLSPQRGPGPALNTTFDRSPPRGPGPALNTTYGFSPSRSPGPALNTTYGFSPSRSPGPALNTTFDRSPPRGLGPALNTTFDRSPPRGPGPALNTTFDFSPSRSPGPALNTTFDRSPPRGLGPALNTTFDRSPPRGPGPALNTTFDGSPPRSPGPALNTTFDGSPPTGPPSCAMCFLGYRHHHTFDSSGRPRVIDLSFSPAPLNCTSSYSGSPGSPGRVYNPFGRPYNMLLSDTPRPASPHLDRTRGPSPRLSHSPESRSSSPPRNVTFSPPRNVTFSPQREPARDIDTSLLLPGATWNEMKERGINLGQQEVAKIAAEMSPEQQLSFMRSWIATAFADTVLLDYFVSSVKYILAQYIPDISLHRVYTGGELLYFLEKMCEKYANTEEGMREAVARLNRTTSHLADVSVRGAENIIPSVAEMVSGLSSRLEATNERAVNASQEAAGLRSQLNDSISRIRQLEKKDESSIAEAAVLERTSRKRKREQLSEDESSYTAKQLRLLILEEEVAVTSAERSLVETELTREKAYCEELRAALRKTNMQIAILETQLSICKDESAHKSSIIDVISDEVVDSFEKSLSQSLALISVRVDEQSPDQVVDLWRDQLNQCISDRSLEISQMDKLLLENVVELADVRGRVAKDYRELVSLEEKSILLDNTIEWCESAIAAQEIRANESYNELAEIQMAVNAMLNELSLKEKQSEHLEAALDAKDKEFTAVKFFRDRVSPPPRRYRFIPQHLTQRMMDFSIGDDSTLFHEMLDKTFGLVESNALGLAMTSTPYSPRRSPVPRMVPFTYEQAKANLRSAMNPANETQRRILARRRCRHYKSEHIYGPGAYPTFRGRELFPPFYIDPPFCGVERSFVKEKSASPDISGLDYSE